MRPRIARVSVRRAKSLAGRNWSGEWLWLWPELEWAAGPRARTKECEKKKEGKAGGKKLTAKKACKRTCLERCRQAR